MRVDEVERVVGERQPFAVGDPEVALEPLLLEVGPRERDRRLGEVDAGDQRAAAGEPREVHAGAAAHFENPASAISVEVDEAQQVMELLEVILIEIVEEPARPDRMLRDLEIVDVPLPVRANVVDRRHAG